MEQKQQQHTIAVYDKPIEKPTTDIPQDFIEKIEARFVTKRFPKDRNTHTLVANSVNRNN